MRQRWIVQTFVLCVTLVMSVTGGTQSEENQSADPRWRDLPGTNTKFVPAVYGTLEEWKARREHLRKQILWSAGLWPLPEKTPLNARIFARKTYADYTVEKVYFESYPGVFVAGNLYRPLNPSARSHPGILNTHGHARTGRLHDDQIASYQARCVTFARMGAVAFMYDMVDYNDSAKQLTGDYADNYWLVHNRPWEHGKTRRALWNVNPLGLQTWDSIRALDFLSSLPEVDPHRLACTGESGGGTQTYMLYAVDDRVKVAAPVCMASALMQGGCVCENAPGLRFDTNNVDIAAMMAPRPLMLVSSARDWTRNTPEVEYPAIKRIYALYGAASHVKNVHVDAQHGYNLAMREAVYQFFADRLGLAISPGFHEPPYVAESKEDLLAFSETIPEGAIRSHPELVDRSVDATKRRLEVFRPTSREQLRQNREVLGMGLKLSTGTNGSQIDHLDYRGGNAAKSEDLSWEEGILLGNRRGVRIPVQLFHSKNSARATNRTYSLLVRDSRSSSATPQVKLIRGLLGAGHTVLVVDVFGIGRAATDLNRSTERFFSTFNRTDDSERVYDIVASIAYCGSSGANDVPADVVNVIGFNDAGPWIAVAGAVVGPPRPGEPQIRFVIDAFLFDTESDEQYLNELFIPGILRAGGLRNAVALIAPRRLLLHNTHTLFDTSWAEAAYRLFYMPDGESRLTLSKSLQADEELLVFLTQP